MRPRIFLFLSRWQCTYRRNEPNKITRPPFMYDDYFLNRGPLRMLEASTLLQNFPPFLMIGPCLCPLISSSCCWRSACACKSSSGTSSCCLQSWKKYCILATGLAASEPGVTANFWHYLTYFFDNAWESPEMILFSAGTVEIFTKGIGWIWVSLYHLAVIEGVDYINL